MCDVCQNVHDQIRKYQQCQEESRRFTLTKRDVKANIKFTILWSQRQCLCCFKDTKNYEAYNNIIQMVMVTAIRLLQNFHDDQKIMNTDEFTSRAAEFESQNDEEAGEAIWSMAELETLLSFISNSLVMSFPLYIVCKHNHICGIEELSTQETSILASYCDVSDAESLSVMLLRNVCFFCDSGGPQAIKKCFEDASRQLGIPILSHTVHSLANLKHWLTMGAIDTYVTPVKASLVRFMCNMSDDNLRQAGNRNITEVAMSLIKETNPVRALFDKDYLKTAFKCFSCSTLKIRMLGLQQLNSQVALYNEALSVQEGEQIIAAGMQLADWLMSSRIIEHIFGPNLHNELVKQSQIVLNFLGNEGKLTVDHIDIIWAAGMQKHCSRQVQDVLILLVKHLTLRPLVHLMDLLVGQEPQCHTEQTLLLVSAITKRFWCMQMQDEKKGTKCINPDMLDTSLDNEIGVCSTDDESEESSESEGEVDVPERPKRSIPIDILQSISTGEDENPVQMLYDMQICGGGRPSQPPTLDTSQRGESSGIASMLLQKKAGAVSPIQPAANSDDYMVISSDNDGTSINHPTLPVTVADLENVPAGGFKRVRSPVSSQQGSVKSVKNLADFDGEDFMSDDELARIEELHRAKAGPRSPRSPPSPAPSPKWRRTRSLQMPFHEELNISIDDPISAAGKYLDIAHITEPGHTILWDLIQEDVAPLLPEGLAHEAEKLLSVLLCIYDMSTCIKLEFIQACITNIHAYRSSTVSLRLLPKLISSFQQPYRAREVHHTTMYIEETFNMMTVFFINLSRFRESLNSGDYHNISTIYGLKVDISVRLQFLSFIYSYIASPEDFCLNRGQVDIIWDCLAMSKDTSDHVLNWLYTQVDSTEFHALSVDTFKYIYSEKLTMLSLKDMTMTGFNLFHLLHEMLSQSNAGDAKGHDTQLWDVALKSQCTEVSLAAIDYLNSCYMSDNDLSREPEFVDRCMNCLLAALSTLNGDPETSLQVVDRGLYLLKNHMDGFRHKYAYQLRMLQLKGSKVVSHQMLQEEKGAQLLKLTLNAPVLKSVRSPSSSLKVTVEVLSSVLLGELRADVTHWWHKLVRQQDVMSSAGDASSSTRCSDTHIRLITNGQELSTDVDKKSLHSLQFKDNQSVMVSTSSNRQKMKQEAVVQLQQVPHLLPMMILVEQPHFDNLFCMLEKLSNAHKTLPKKMANRHIICSRSRVLSRRVWELLMLVPTNPSILQSISELSDKERSQLDWAQLLDSTQPSKLIYSLQIVESLSKNEKRHKPNLTILSDTEQVLLMSEGNQQTSRDNEVFWSRKFIMDGGLLHLFNVLVDRRLEEANSQLWNDWDQDAFAYLLRLLCQFAVVQLEDGDCPIVSVEVKRSPPLGQLRRQHTQRAVIPSLNKMILEMIDSRYADMFNIIHSVIYDTVLPANNPSPAWGRYEARVPVAVLHQAMLFLVFWAYSDSKVKDSLLHSTDPSFTQWLRRLTLEAPESQLRHEACKSLYKLCLGQQASGENSGPSPYATMTLSALLELLPIAVSMEPLMNEAQEQADNRKCKLGASSQDYLWLTGQLLDSMDDNTIKQLDLEALGEQLRDYIASRRFYEQRHSAAEDEGLIGLFNLQAIVIKHCDRYKQSDAAKKLLSEVFDDLFLLPCIKKRHLPKCKSNSSRVAAYDLLVELVKGSLENYTFLHTLLVTQHDRIASYPWDYWPMEDVRSVSGYVGLQNLGATCYMATCMQHLYMIPQARQLLLQAKSEEIYPAYTETLKEMKRMFAYLMESERKSYNPQNFCKVYEMDRQPLNTGEQKDMTEFFTDLISKLEEMSPDLKALVKDLFGGVTSNNVVSLDCPHVSKTLEAFYTIRCQVTDMKNLYESLDEVCVKDTLDGDNMYTCSRCQKKVRAEKRACFKRLPKILCFNTMRYTFNMVTMLKEKINTHFSFPHQLSMADYMESNLIQPDKLLSKGGEPSDKEDASNEGTAEERKEAGSGDSDDKPMESGMEKETKSTDYELIGVTVHTGTADGGHYYSFIRDRVSVEPGKPDKWFLFNDSEVKAFDPAQIAQECFGGEMTSTTYDSIAEKFMDFSFEKTNSAYMLFYERVDRQPVQSTTSDLREELAPVKKDQFELSEELADWIWRDNTSFLQDKNIFCHHYYQFMWQMCAYIPTTLPRADLSVRVLPAQLSTLFLLETFIHAKEKPTMVQWIELLTKQFNQCPKACEWLLDKMSTDDHWSKQILIGCSNQMIRQMFQRLIIHVVTQLRIQHYSTNQEKPPKPWLQGEGTNGNVVSRFICKHLQILQHPDMQLTNCKYLAEYFSFLFEFARFGAEEKQFLLDNDCIGTMVTFYIGEHDRPKSTSSQSGGSSDEEEDTIKLLVEERYKVSSLEKMIHLIALLVESSRVERSLELSSRDMDLLVGGRGMRFLVSQIKDGINPKQTCNLIFSLCRWDEELAATIVDTLLNNAVRSRSVTSSQMFLKVLTMTTEMSTCPPGHPQFTELILLKFWVICEKRPHQFLEWMSNLVCHNSIAHAFILDNLKLWVEKYLLLSHVPKVRTWAMLLLVSLVPSQSFRNFARTVQADRFSSTELNVKSQMSPEAVPIMHDIYVYLLELMPTAKKYADMVKYGTSQLVSYLSFLSLCLISREEKMMFTEFFAHLWQMFQPKMTDPQVSINQNKQALLLFWYHACHDCPENINMITANMSVTKNIAFNYILADHDDQDVVAYNRCMLPAYYGILKLCCQRSRAFTRHLAQHQNMMWAFQHILPYPAHYTIAVEELMAILHLIVTVHPDSSKEEEEAVYTFKKKILSMYLQTLNSRSDWHTLLMVLKIVLVTDEDRLAWILMTGLTVLSETFGFIHGMYHEATACHVLTDLSECLLIIKSLLTVANSRIDEENEAKTVVLFDGTERSITLLNVLNSWDKTFLIKNCVTLLNSYSPTEVRLLCLDVLKKLSLLVTETVIDQLAPQLLAQHMAFSAMENQATHCCLDGPYFPSRNPSKGVHAANITVRPPQPQFGMFLHSAIIDSNKQGQDAAYVHMLSEFYFPYYLFVDFMVRVAVNKDCLTDELINLNACVAFEGIPLHPPYFAKLWCEIYHAQKSDKDLIKRLCNSHWMVDYMDSILHDDLQSLNNQHIYLFFTKYFKMVYETVMIEENSNVPLQATLIESLHHIGVLASTQMSALNAFHGLMQRANADARALLLIYEVLPPTEYDTCAVEILLLIKGLCMGYKVRLTRVAEVTAAQAASATAKPLSATEDNQRVPELSQKSPQETDHEVPSKKRRMSSSQLPNEDEVVKEKLPKVTIEYRPVSTAATSAAATNTQVAASVASKGQNRTGINKGKAPAKKQHRPGPASQVKSSKPFSDDSASTDSSNNQTGSDAMESSVSPSGTSPSQSALAVPDECTGGVGSDPTTTPESLSGSGEMMSKAKRKIDMTDNLLDTIGAILSIIHRHVTDDEMT